MTLRSLVVLASFAVSSGVASAQARDGLPRLVQVVSIGCDDCEGALQFPSIADVSVGGAGAFLVVASQEPMLRMFDRTGKLLWTAGKRGKGPGEFESPFKAVRAGTEWGVVDLALRRISRVSAGGAFVASAQLGGFPTAIAAQAGGSGSFMAVFDDFRGNLTWQQWGLSGPRGEARPTPRPLPADTSRFAFPSVAYSAEGELAYNRNGSMYGIMRARANGGELPPISRDVAAVRRSPAEQAELQRGLARGGQLRSAEARGGRGGGAATPVPPSELTLKPHLWGDGLRYDDSGRLWVLTARGDERATVFDLFAKSGAYIGEVKVPARINKYSLGGPWMAAVSETADGVPRVLLFEIK